MNHTKLPVSANVRQRISKAFCILSCVLLSACGSDKNGDTVFFSIEEDLKLGQQVAKQVDSTYEATGKLLNRNSSDPKIRAAYQHLDQIVERLLATDQVSYREEFPWDVKIIKDAENLNAFATPGGHIYVFTGLINKLETEDELAGVLGHEIAHADQRHSIKQLQKQYGISFITKLLLGDNAGELERVATSVAGHLTGLKFSRDYEREADEYSVLYLGATNYYACDGAAGFFQKMQNLQNSGNPPEFISTHPAPGNRIQQIQAEAKQRGCNTQPAANTRFQEFKRNLSL
ncbi:M48 family metallopeptidase [Rufibacter glacialis]|uniref:M48 family metallopeptidase n=1 Tax=Rufibacter glacialis TaxID=1259555 RepID=A0A5M8QA39_9BACT|nr:M48 family metallopeptidase [Rufibacter glacialis]KAA6431941.1 M48 family metalloprotease [Rufibacter glacialis]GGK80229.1 peptidase M48 [Rufibacter glacialis]